MTPPRDPRAEAATRLGGGRDVRVLEPSPPAVTEPPWFADDPVAGGEVVPVERTGSTSWATVAANSDDDELAAWCEDRWLVRGPLAPLPPMFATTRSDLHALAEHMVAPIRQRAVGKIGLRFTHRGFGTPFLPGDRQVRLFEGLLVDRDRRQPLTTLAAAASFLDAPVGSLVNIYAPTTDGDPQRVLRVDPIAATELGHWFGFATSVLEQLRADARPDDTPSRVQLWPEHFDLAVDLGPDGSRANFGASPGDAEHPEPYLYVGPWEPQTGEFWNEPFGASLAYGELLDGADPRAWFGQARELLA